MKDVVLYNLSKFFLSHTSFIAGVVINIVLIYILCKLTDVLHKNIEINLKKKNSDLPLLNLLPILSRILKLVIIFLLLAGFLQSFGYNVTSLVAGFGITGLAVGFAAKETLGNIFGSIGLLSDKVYKIGDYIKFNDIEGAVEQVNLRSTSIRTTDGYLINVPNNVISNAPITNISMANKRKIDVSVDIEYSTSNEKIGRAIDVLKEIAESNPDILEGELVFIDNLAPSSIVIKLVAYTLKTSYADVVNIKNSLYKEIIRRYRVETIEFAFPSTSVYMVK